ncbi:hypothetical protein LOZ61_004309 [Ophidiomyces ophidiicola]|nr:hypothetical protein LOZ61_004309 [Ophidiomyces ophidiicola]KAI1925793.1 hypothetical protein LOZ60_003951 [Ophidiomyces ophidiicola]KAI1955839.1 hypothetical protein LOZ59_004409 [Ophidiomyces ophidiicola]KAI2139089.1 hypothetical protein LOZ27_005338 [Ophidiomyces ophidiicola]KAI2238941.1 hypothetical protein LOZ13_003650 [Ophidiomyces ophidiicola]
MDAKAYLISQGWSGPGNPLNPLRRPGGHAGLGLTKPILVARKKNTHGIGNKTTHDHTNQWWLRGFEEALKSVGNDGNSTLLENAPDEKQNGIRSELYRFFVRGEKLEGTIEKRVDGIDTVASSNHVTKRKRDEGAAIEDEARGDSEKKKKKRKKDLADSERPGVSDSKKSADRKRTEKSKRDKKSKSPKKRQSTPNKMDEAEVLGTWKKKEKPERLQPDFSTPTTSPSKYSGGDENGVKKCKPDKDTRMKQKKLRKMEKESKQKLKSKKGKENQ